MLMSKKKELIPKLRFPEFVDEGEWEEKILGKLAKKIVKKNKDGLINNVFTNSAIDGIVDQRDFFDKDIANKNNLENYYIVEDGDYVYNPRISNIAPVGPISKNKTKKRGVLSPLYTVFRFTNKNNDFYEYYFKTIHWYSAIRKASNTGARFDRMSITDSVFMNIPILYPLPSEQQKIASCLSSLDEMIAAQVQKLDLLKDHKKGLMQNLFPQEGEKVPKFRFKEFENNGEWIERKLGEIAHISKLAGYEFTKHIVYENKGKIIALRGLNIKNNGLELSDVKYIDNSELNKLNRSKLFIDDLMFTYIGTIGEVALIPENDKYYLAPNVSRIRPNKKEIYAKFLLQYFNVPNFKGKEISKYISSSSQPALTMENVRKFSILLPNLNEQQKIASCLSSLDTLITAHTEKIEQLKLHKKGLIQGLFPKMND
ncbi:MULTISPECIES: restriction endonuclease subunit S [unclassified Apibacter]|uniref:restriction endonuclease subunit S n=1 Tax=unclassified Apibacter TaxID=2630820 RepID=UPI00132B7047|nr:MULTISPECIES: restriction endonuclease subunit S [unclassified Apibacter]MCX8676222.1 restriction endonuclease subunit S [Apibacter sp. B3919]MXO25228.1 restriction endonuclease subunit S [Apibacter sp. B3924]MXO26629.1 restriction endonuclease subunit S [Apibacter sp. B3813]MXO29358.1 restriction endonuclease subunit S [Apibacter sp. B3913]MXO30907.1 restriction endonuclease subunit S [Apibacter sp. B3912]